jgi:phospholipase/carboxylesterase
MDEGPLSCAVSETDGDPLGALVLLHGRGADERDLEPLLRALDPERRLLGLLPRGPLALPPGGRHWYIVQQVGYPDPGTFLPTFERLERCLEETLARHGLVTAQAVLGGFSQGAVMAYSLALASGRPSPPAILAFSGFLPRVERFEVALANRRGLPVAISHGTHDPVIGVGFAREARARLEEAGLAVSYREDPAGHTITPGALAQAKEVLTRALS